MNVAIKAAYANEAAAQQTNSDQKCPEVHLTVLPELRSHGLAVPLGFPEQSSRAMEPDCTCDQVTEGSNRDYVIDKLCCVEQKLEALHTSLVRPANTLAARAVPDNTIVRIMKILWTLQN